MFKFTNSDGVSRDLSKQEAKQVLRERGVAEDDAAAEKLLGEKTVDIEVPSKGTELGGTITKK